jgi:hypothetical protein
MMVNQYDPLREGCIRLVQLTRTLTPGIISCQTTQFSLQECPSYAALSYACGAKPARSMIKLNGSDWFVRKNLWRFLDQYTALRNHLDGVEWLWIDAICINQNDNLEKPTKSDLWLLYIEQHLVPSFGLVLHMKEVIQ